jgi:hypothetical protein
MARRVKKNLFNSNSSEFRGVKNRGSKNRYPVRR